MEVKGTYLAFMVVTWMALHNAAGAAEGLPAFPGAEGFGADTPGGRGGKVTFVTNLKDYDPETEEPIPGSLRAACETRGPRIVVFRVAGTITLKSKLDITEPFITIAGQTAPGGGICLRDCTVSIGTAKRPTRDVVVRYLRIRTGDEGPQNPDSIDPISIENANHVVVDHCSVSWGVDETFTIHGAQWYPPEDQESRRLVPYVETHDITVQWCIISEGLDKSIHPAVRHSKGMMIDGGANRVTIHHNLIMHNDMRNPLLPCEKHDPTIVDMVNNVVYNWGRRAGDAHKKTNQSGDMNFTGNYYIMGPNSEEVHSLRLGVDTRVYARGNIGPFRTSLDQDEYAGIRWYGPRERKGLKAEQRFDTPPVTTHSYLEAYKLILAAVGANLPERDAVDLRLIKELQTRTGRIIDHPSDVGGWPELSAGAAPKDGDNDGMPDEWEHDYGLDPNDSSDNNADPDNDGYTNIEEFLNGTDPNAGAVQE